MRGFGGVAVFGGLTVSESLLVQISIGVFVLGFFSVVWLAAARFLVGIDSVTIEMGIGPKLFVVDLNRFRYQINLLPIPILVQRSSYVRRSQSIRMDLMGMVGLLLLAFAFIYATLKLSGSASFEPYSSAPVTDRSSRAVITSILPGTPAEKAGLSEGMIICSVNGLPIESGIEPVIPNKLREGTLDLEVGSDHCDKLPIKTSLKREDKTFQALGLTYVVKPQFPETVSNKTLPLLYETTKAGFYGLGQVSRINPTFFPVAVGFYPRPTINTNLLVYAAALAMLLAIVAFLRALLPESFPLWALLILYAVKASWLGILVPLVLLALGYFYRERALANYISIIGLVWFFFFPPAPILYGLYIGLVSQIGQLEHLEMLWRL
jgi:hypothetical protein